MFRVSDSKKKKKGAKTTALLEKKFPLTYSYRLQYT